MSQEDSAESATKGRRTTIGAALPVSHRAASSSHQEASGWSKYEASKLCDAATI